MSVSIQVQAVLYNTAFPRVRSSLESFRIAAARAGCDISFLIGDASPSRCISDADLVELNSDVADVSYVFFDENTGFGEGHNRLAKVGNSEYILITNPDVLVSADFFLYVLKTASENDRVGIVEARQTPIEHPKEYELASGRVDWCSGACMLTPRSLFISLNGFDSATFWMYCEDVDYSWRVRAAGYATVYQPRAIAFHPKRLSHTGGWVPTQTERVASAEASLLLAYKWGRNDEVRKMEKLYRASGDPAHSMALSSFQKKRKSGCLKRLDSGLDSASFYGEGYYAKHRFAL